jgi:hypothetical protein
VRFGAHVADGGFDGDSARLKLAKVRESGDEADGAVATHADEADVVEEDDAELVGGVGWFAEKCADDGVVAARFVDDGGAEAVVGLAEDSEAVAHGAAAEIGGAGNDEPGGFTAGVRINYLNAHGGIGL